MELKPHFTFSKQQRSGILLLLLFIVALLGVYWFVDFSEEDSLDTSSAEIVALQKEMDSLRSVELESRNPKIYPFNPNYITDFKGYTLGMTTEEIDKLHRFRKEGKWINSAADFKAVTGVSDSLLNVLSPLFKFPEWVSNPKPKQDYKDFKSEKGFSEKSFAQKNRSQQSYRRTITTSKRYW
jgi:hypothetical protein